LGPCLFLAYINDLPLRLSSQTRLFADDTALHRPVQSRIDQQLLQQDLQMLEEWEQKWDMQFHPGKCITLPVTRRHVNNRITPADHQLHGHTLENVTSVKYLGVTIGHNLSWDEHIDSICSKANSTLGFLRRNLRVGSTHIKEVAYKTFVRPILEYASTVWDPHTQTNVNKIEMVQRRAARFVLNKYHRTASVSNMLEHLGWEPLQTRRKNARLAMLFKIQNDLVHVSKSHLIPKPIRPRRGQARQHSKQYVEDISHLQDYRTESFFPRTVRDWNNLPQKTVDADTLDTFVSRLRSSM